MTEKIRLVEGYFKWNSPRARWQQVDLGALSLFYPNYARKYVFSNGKEVIRNPGESLWDDETGRIPEIDD